jgi:hypothetical protein
MVAMCASSKMIAASAFWISARGQNQSNFSQQYQPKWQM